MNPMSQSEKLELLKLLTSLRAKNRCKVLKLLDDNSVNFICECVFNVCFTDLKLSRNKRKKLKSKLKSQEKVLRYLARKDNSVKNRRYLPPEEVSADSAVIPEIKCKVPEFYQVLKII